MKKGKMIFCSLLVVCTAWSGLAYSYDNLGYGVRATGMGAFVGLADDPSAIFYNPAGIAQLERPQLYLMYDKISKFTIGENENPYLLSGVGVYPLNDKLRFFLGGSQKGSLANPTGVVTNNVGIVGLAGWLAQDFSLGLNGKFLYNSNYGKKKGVDLDLGLFYRFSPKFSVGVAMENLLATDMTPDNGDTLGYAIREGKIGFAYHFDMERYSTILAWDIRVKNSTKPESKSYTLSSLGIEEWILTGNSVSFGLRGGYTFGKQFEQDINQPSFGLSLRYNGGSQTFQLDYSFQKYPYKAPQSSTGDHRVSLSIAFGGKNGSNHEYARKDKVKRFQIQTLPAPPVTASSNQIIPPEKKTEEKVVPPAVSTENKLIVPEKKAEEKKQAKVTAPEKPVVVPEKKAEETKLTQTTPPPETPVIVPEKKAEEQKLTQVIPQENPVIIPENKTEEKKPIPVTTYQPFSLSSSVEELSSGRNRSIMFMLKPDFEEQIDFWRLYICQDKPSGYGIDQLKPILLKTVEGKGVPSSGIIWDCRYNGKSLKKGTYYYAMELVDSNGQRYFSQWKSFKLK
ncbi:MAG: hypothetical protein A2W07_06215 [candidate division Zixibacteria bacterium RBG_16_43_9]|nr:MAG: hypothetical protein A2W07_06215 [candidate division Zixibacteria bacterium RBG_16_43_9]